MRRVEIGLWTDLDEVQVSEEYGGGTVSLNAMQWFAHNYWNDYPDQSGLSRSLQSQGIREAIDRVKGGKTTSRQDTVDRVLTAAGRGYDEGATVLNDAMSLYMIDSLHDKSLRIQQDAVARGDVGTQFAYGFGKAGVHGVQALLLIPAVEGLAATATGQYLLATKGGVAAIGTLKASSTFVAGAMGAAAYYEGQARYYSALNGDYTDAAEHAGNSLLSAGFSAELVRASIPLGFRPEPISVRNWQTASLGKAIERHAGPYYSTWLKENGKLIFEKGAFPST